ncbi:hypothetical protein VKT23_016207 [Stygiomarasmius scandens]|uniref:DUF4939 domain-containing protein n=1 Tax=Marasmiellus scandens TaxID=2682957 RepID=A0ABR1IYV1_9AGAR
MQQKLDTFIENLNNLKPQKLSTSNPEPYEGKSDDGRRFLLMFKIWGAQQKDLTDDPSQILSALSFMHGSAADWVAHYANLANNLSIEGSTVKFPFEGKWEEFEKQFKTCFGSADEEAEAQQCHEDQTLTFYSDY